MNEVRSLLEALRDNLAARAEDAHDRADMADDDGRARGLQGLGSGLGTAHMLVADLLEAISKCDTGARKNEQNPI